MPVCVKVVFLIVFFVIIPYILGGTFIFYNFPFQEGNIAGPIIFFSICGIFTTLVAGLYGFHCARYLLERQNERTEDRSCLITVTPKFSIDAQYPQTV